MEDKLKSQICTTVEQSQRLLALGLKPETADMALVENWDWSVEDGKYFTGEYFERPIDYVEDLKDKWIPAWSLHRLIQIYRMKIIEFEKAEEIDHLYEILIKAIEIAIERGTHSKEYFNHEV